MKKKMNPKTKRVVMVLAITAIPIFIIRFVTGGRNAGIFETVSSGTD